MMRPIFPLSVLAFAALAGSLQAGSSVASSGQTASQIEDLGEIVEDQEAELKSKFRFNVTARGEFTSNAQLTGRHDSNDFIFLPVIEAGYTQPLGPKFSLDFAAKVDLGLYSNNSDRAFIGYSFKSTLDYHPSPRAPRLFISIEPYRYDNIDVGDLLTQAIGFSVGTDWGYAFNEGRSLFFTGYSYTGYVADPASDTRHTHKLVAGVSHQFRSDLTGQVFYAWQYTDFINFDRHDSKHLVGLNLIYQINQDWFATLGGAFADNDSDINLSSYQSVSGSLGVTYQF
jgi:hypothetical protein